MAKYMGFDDIGNDLWEAAKGAFGRAAADAAQRALDSIYTSYRGTGGGKRRRARPPMAPPGRRGPSYVYRRSIVSRKRKFRSYKRYKRKRGHPNRGFSYGYSITKPINTVSNYRVVTIRQELPITLATSAQATWAGRDVVNGLSIECGQLRIGVQPFTMVGRYGTTKMYHSVSPVVDAAGNACSLSAHQGEDYPDIVAVSQRYASMRVAGLRVALHLFGQGVSTSTGSGVGWQKATSLQMQVRAAFDRLDNQPGDTAAATDAVTEPDANAVLAPAGLPKMMTLETFRRMPYYKEFNWNPSSTVNTKAVVFKKVLFSRHFPVSRGLETINPIGNVTSGPARQTVLPGQWDHNPIYDTTYANAFERAQDGTGRAGALYVDLRTFAAGHDADVLTFDKAAAIDLVIGKLEVTHKLAFKNDLDAMGRPRGAIPA